MIKFCLPFSLICIVSACVQTAKPVEHNSSEPFNKNHELYSSSVNDSFFINVHLPGNYYTQDTTYPVVFVLDANLYGDIYNVIEDKYAEVGLLPNIILVNVGYKDFPAMDSLRNRDYTYPVAIPDYEMTVSGGADKFLSFFRDQLVNYIDSHYRTDKHNRVLMGHSLGGYFALYSLYKELEAQQSLFSGYIAASPSSHYNHYYIINALEKISGRNKNLKAYISAGGLEDNPSDTSAMPAARVFASLRSSLQQKNSIALKTDTFSDLDHLDTQIPSFIKGLQWMFLSE